jgi:hypothetical protein
MVDNLNHHIRHDGVINRVDQANISIEHIDDVDYEATKEQCHHRKNMRDKIDF